MEIIERIARLRQLMAQKGWDAALVSGTDPHASEYLPLHWQQRRFISGFTGSYGTVVVTKDHAGLWTDTRYFIQATRQLQGTGIELHKLRVPEAVDYPEWLAAYLSAGSVVGFDGWCISQADALHLKEVLGNRKIEVDCAPDYLSDLWSQRDALPMDPVFLFDDRFTGRSRADKLAWLRYTLLQKNCTSILLNSLDQIAWLLNIRGNDIAYTPVAIAYLYVNQKEALLCIEPQKVGENEKAALLKDGVKVHPYAEARHAILQSIGRDTVWLDDHALNYWMFQAVVGTAGVEYKVGTSPVLLEKALKNPVEIEGYRKAYLKDGIVQTRFFHWLEKEVQAGHPVSELEASDQQAAIRREMENSLGESFAPISAYGENAALPHYMATPGKFSYLQPKGLYLIDSGGHYLDGTTDITRTVPLGPLTPLEREDYTLVLKGMIGLTTAIFPRGTRGANIDALARIPLWKKTRNFGHGTGHGVGHLLCVHEGPQDLRQNVYDQAMLPGMVTSCEPGLYREGLHGVRHEDMLLCVPLPSNEFGDWLGFETLTCTYIDPAPLLPELLTGEEKQWLTDYNQSVYERLRPYLNKEDLAWLKAKTVDFTW